jgi:putative glutamine amidotransferase
MYCANSISHSVRVTEGTLLHEILGGSKVVSIPFKHRQCGTIGEGFAAAAYSLPDNVVEAIELPGSRFVLGIQWHPEGLIHNDTHQLVFRRLVEVAAAYKLKKEGK